MLKNGTPASPATARASSVLPVPGGPNNKTPLGMRAPSCWNFLGFSRNSLISCSSSTVSSMPATSLKVTLGESTLARLARLLPKLITLEPPPCIWFMMKNQKPRMSTSGRMNDSRLPQSGLPGFFETSCTLNWSMSWVVVVVDGYETVYLVLLASFSVTCSVWFLVFMTIAEMRPFCRSLTKLWGVLVVATSPVVGVTL